MKGPVRVSESHYQQEVVPNYASIKVQVNSLLDLSAYELSRIIPNCFLLEMALVIIMTATVILPWVKK